MCTGLSFLVFLIFFWKFRKLPPWKRWLLSRHKNSITTLQYTSLKASMKNQPLETFYKKGVLKNFTCKFCKIFQDIFLIEHLWTVVPEPKKQTTNCSLTPYCLMSTIWPTLFKNLLANDRITDTKHCIVKRKSKGSEFQSVVEKCLSDLNSLSYYFLSLRFYFSLITLLKNLHQKCFL